MSPRLLLTGALLVLLPSPARAAVAAPRGHREDVAPGPADVRARARAILETVDERAGPTGPALELARLGAPAAGVCFDLLAGEGDGPSEAEWSAVQRETLLVALERFPLPAVRSVLAEQTAAGSPVEARAAGLAILARIGTSADVDLLARIAGGEDVPDAHVLLGPAIEAAAAGILARHPRACESVAGLLSSAHPTVAFYVLQALAETPAPWGSEIMAKVLGARDELAAQALSLVGRTAGRDAAPAPTLTLLDAVRPYLDDPRTGVRREAALAVGRLGDHESVPVLVELLEEDHEGVRDAAHWSLGALTGLAFPADARRWRVWYRGELEWRQTRYLELEEILRHGSAQEVGGVVGEVVERRLFRDEYARDLTFLLRSAEPGVRLIGCQALRELRSRAAVSELIDHLEDPDVDVAAAAHTALQATLGYDLPPDPNLWRSALASGGRATDSGRL